MRNLSYTILAGSLILNAYPLRAETVNQVYSVTQGNKIMIEAIYALKDDCSPGPFPQMTIKKMPANGQIKAGKANFPISTDKNCPNVSANSLAISYFPYPNFAGDEKISASITMPNGKEVDFNWLVKVNPRVESLLRSPASAERTALK